MAKYTITKIFDTRVERSPRVLEVAEAFGIGLDDKKFVIYDGLEVNVEPGDCVYIHGQSGSGKSLLLKDLSAQMADSGQGVAVIDNVEMLDMALVDQIGQSTDEALRIMNMAGLNDAYLFVRKPDELSDGQRYRFRLSKLIESGADVWVADEFGATLDRETAKIVSHNIRKAAYKMGKTLIVATTHTDLVEYLAPTVSIVKTYGDRVEIKHLKWNLES